MNIIRMKIIINHDRRAINFFHILQCKDDQFNTIFAFVSKKKYNICMWVAQCIIFP